MRISFWKRLAFYILVSLVIMVLLSLFAEDSDARAGIRPAGATACAIAPSATPESR
ncbi:hypothetical protein P1P91_03780 [Halomonas piscis]|uniref:Uncharacterized protein n=1 Tax=Halomonas piscis TaxID=3031727 RepID=A0ABY9Z2C5_9GAMM|nr:hypothetical protein [Halomonas piscis]WNK20811.1 hypothetical protein P1P91_03780 [Halomonas piscis]